MSGEPVRGHAPPTMAFVATCDLVGLTRGRAVPFTDQESLSSSGLGWVPANLAITAGGHIVEENLFGSTGDLRLVADPATRTDVPADGDDPGTRLYLADQIKLDGTSWECCPRTALKAALADLRERTGLRVTASFEHEFMLDGLPDTAPFSFARLRSVEPFGSELLDLLEAASVPVENWLPEYGPGQFEITTRPCDALRAADRAIIVKDLVRDLARRRGIKSTFAPLLAPEGTGNGVHIHLSLRDEGGHPVLHDPDLPGELSDLGARFAGGILAHVAPILGVTAPAPTSLLRLAPHRWSAGGAYLGDRDREALLRICPTTTMSSTPVPAQFNLEFRAADATANPWLSLAALVRAGLHGIDHGEAASVTRPTTDGLDGIEALPGETTVTLDALENDPVASGWFDPTLLATHLAVRRQDLADVAHLTPAEQCEVSALVY